MMVLGFYGLKSIHKYSTTICSKIKLHKCGTKVQLQTPIDPIGRIDCKIEEIRRPSKIDENLLENGMVMMGLMSEQDKQYPVFIRDKLMLL